ncbi:Protein transport protein Sec31A [Trichoplax sp. H2]|nr:Protein transport protein Sec31A [Trichoplax sp. H2]|eukprot:RDD47413.1 Protein transport protein Sec31A [Trichoplax sp. H2]
MRIKDVHKAATVAWSPTNISPIYVAAGSTAGQNIRRDFLFDARLEILSVEPGDSSLDMPQGFVSFKKLAWNSTQQRNDFGLLAGSATDAKIYLYSVKNIMKHEEEHAVLSTLEKHSEAASDLDFNPFQKNLLASSAKAGELYIWDLNQVDRDPLVIGSKFQITNNLADMSCVTWNLQVPHIIASSSSVGHTVVWDMRKTEKPVITLNTGNALVNCHTMSWHPRIATQLVQANSTESMWDVRYMQYPIKIFSEHKRGIHAVAWCNQDADMLASCGKDSKVLIWNPNGSVSNSESNIPSGELVYEIPCNSCMDVRWCPRMPILVSLMTADDYIQIYSLISGSQKQQSQFAEQQHKQISEAFGSDFANIADVPNSPKPEYTAMPLCPKYPPKCLKVSAGASFAFGGKLITLNPSKDTNSTEVAISQVVTNEVFIERAKKLDNAIADNGNLIAFCDERLKSSGDDYESLQWGFLKANFLKEPRKKIIELLGCHHFDTDKELPQLSSVDEQVAIQDENALQDEEIKRLETSSASIIGDNYLKDMKPIGEIKPECEPSMKTDSRCDENSSEKAFTISFSDDSEKLLGKLLLVGNLTGAVEACINSGKMAEAILLAIAAGPETLEKTRSSFFSKRIDNLSRLIYAIISRDWSDIVKACSLSNWREILTILLTYARADEFSQYCSILGERLESSADADHRKYAGLCYICAGRTHEFASWWMRLVDFTNSKPNELQCLMEKIALLKKSVEVETGSIPGFSANSTLKIFSQYAGLLCAEGQLQLAMNYLESLPSEQDKEFSLKERLCYALDLSGVSENRHKSKQIQRADSSNRTLQNQNDGAFKSGGLSNNVVNNVATEPTSRLNLFTPYSASMVPSAQIGSQGGSKSLSSDPKPGSLIHDENQPREKWNRVLQPSSVLMNQAPTAAVWKNESKSLTAWNDPPMLLENVQQAQTCIDKEPIKQPIPGNENEEVSANVGNERRNMVSSPQIAPPKLSAYQSPTNKLQITSEKLQKPIPASHMILYEIFNNQIEKGKSRLTNPVIKRKLDDIAKRLATLYELLREEILSPDILQGLHDIAQAVKAGDYNGGIKIHKAVVARGNFSQITSFMPGLKMLMQLSLQYKI